MKFYKKTRLGVSILFLLLLITTSITLFNLSKENGIYEGNALSMSAPEDSYEPNNDWTTAYDLSTYEKVWLETINGLGAQYDDDWFKIQVSPGEERLVVFLLFKHIEGDIDIEIYNNSLAFIGGNYSITDDEFIDIIVPVAGQYYIKVYLGNAGNAYNLLWDDMNPLALDDVFEENDDPGTAFNISMYQNMWLSSINELGIQSDDDWFEIYINPGFEHLRVHCIFNNDSGNIDLDLYTSSMAMVANSWLSGNHEIIDTVLPSNETYFIRVHYGNGGNVYDLLWQSLPTEDSYEENDNWTTAYDLAPWAASWLPFGPGILNDEDWFRIYLDPGEERIIADLTFNHLAGNIDMELFDWNFAYITGSHSLDNNEYLDVNVGSNGTYYLRIYSPDPYTGNVYDLWWEDLTPTGGDDWMEENDDFWSSKWVNPNYYSNLMINETDEDWFHIFLNPGDVIDIAIYFNHMEGDLELVLYDPTYIQRMDSLSSNDDEYITYMADMSGDWRIQVYHAAGDTKVYYDLDIWLNAGDDWAEENDDFWSSRYVDPMYHSGLKLVGSDEDWFHIYLNSGDTLHVDLFFNHFEGDLELELFDPSYINRMGSYSGDDDEFITFTADMSGDWRIRVFHAFGNSSVYYDLKIWLEDMPSTGDDGMEENDGFWDAWLLDPNYFPNLRVVKTDEDWFQLYLNDGDVVDVSIFFNKFEGNLDLELYDPSYNLRDGSYSNTNYESVIYTADVSGDWRIRVYHAVGDSEVKYDMNIWIKDDAYEYNDDLSVFQDNKNHPSILVEFERKWLSNINGLAVQENYDWYVIDVTPGFRHLQVNVLFNHSMGNIDLTIYDKSGSIITGNYSMSDDEYIDFVLPYPGIFLVLVHGDNMRNEYNLWWDDLRTDFRSDDSYEMNNDLLSAHDLTHSQNISLWQVPPNNGAGLQYDNDWYEIYVEEGFEQLKVWLIYDSAEGLIGFEVYDENNNKITGNFTLTDHDFIDYEVPSNGTYYIRVFGDNSGNVYDLWWSTERPEEAGMIPGYEPVILIVSIVGITAIIIKMKRSKLTRK
ncbi:MAG: PPC domain-containing protein [Promethearchaeota archaeon]|jgi:hypothetical protein